MKINRASGSNMLLASFPPRFQDRLRPHLRHLEFEIGQPIYEVGAAMEETYFPIEGTLSAVVVMADGGMIEAATIGNEGGVGLPMLGQITRAPNCIFVQVPGRGVRIETALFEREARSDAGVGDKLANYQAAFIFQVSQSVACNGLHPILQRACRWLLMTHDRVAGNEIRLTHEFFATMLGVRRASVTDTLQQLESSRIIENGRGLIRVIDREALERTSCECYNAVRSEYERLLQYNIGST